MTWTEPKRGWDEEDDEDDTVEEEEEERLQAAGGGAATLTNPVTRLSRGSAHRLPLLLVAATDDSKVKRPL